MMQHTTYQFDLHQAEGNVEHREEMQFETPQDIDLLEQIALEMFGDETVRVNVYEMNPLNRVATVTPEYTLDWSK